ncbi:MAG: hypothetical protein IJM17_09935 [Firmicutes bacterium]|nr:hypothetical protein [Bacillota bacterium]
MKHLVMVKWNDSVSDKKALAQEVLALFERARDENAEIKEVSLVLNAVDLPNRYDCLFIIELDKENIPVWNNCGPHLIWKRDYSKYVLSKAIFDWE